MLLRGIALTLLGTALILLAVFVQGERVLSVGSINPNLLLVLFFLALFGYRVLPLFFIWVGVLLAISFLWMPFWVPQFFVLAVVLACFGGLRSFFTGTAFFDFLIAVGGGTLLFYAVSALFTSALWDTLRVLSELVYNVVLGAALWILVRERGSWKGFLRRINEKFL